MENGLVKDKPQWYVMRAYKNESTAEERLSDEKYGLTHFIPKEKVLRTINGKKVICMVPVIHSLVFVYASHKQIVDFKLLLSDKTLARAHTCIRPQKKGKETLSFPKDFVILQRPNFKISQIHG
ncbi:MAG: transcription termination/antitermination NusG family protein, partial [Prevotella sp.]|nr:transcription termination/antitermination NusG family protein [Prevotella sp.]